VARLAQDRLTHLTRDEIAAEALRQFDAGGKEPSIRSLAAALTVAPTAIYHHYASRAAIVDAAIELVWAEAAGIGLELVTDLRTTPPEEVLLAAGLATRRAFVRHHRLASYLASTTASERITDNLAVIAGAFERLGLRGEAAAEAFHAYASFTIGSILILTARLTLGEERGGDARPAPGAPAGEAAGEDATRAALEAMTRMSVADPARDEELFVRGLRRLVADFAEAGAP
jgi:AcrR family transcriptional regulator